MGLLEKLYEKSPIVLQNLMVTISGYQRNRTRYGKEYYKYLEFLLQFDTWSLEEKLELQLKELKKLIKHAINNSEFYRNLYAGIEIDSINSIEDLKKLPVIDKEMLRKNIDDVFTVAPKDSIEGYTGGTTGKSLMVLFTPDDMMKRMAMLDHFKARVGFEHRKMRRATFNGKHIISSTQTRKIYWRYNAACKQMIYSSFHLTEENMEYYVKSLNKFKPHAIDGFFTSICDIANYIERHSLVLEFTPIAIFPTSETLTKPGRELLERVFKSKVYDQYASSEGAPFITECENQVLHLELATGVFEHLNDSSDEILVTSFTTEGTPLIRYRIGDSITFGEKRVVCDCGMEVSTIDEIRGRKLDFIYTSEGAKINGGNIANLFKNMPNSIIRAQVIQNEINKLIIKLEVDKNLYKAENDNILRKELSSIFGDKTNLTIIHVDEIPREKSGKFKMIKNNLAL